MYKYIASGLNGDIGTLFCNKIDIIDFNTVKNNKIKVDVFLHLASKRFTDINGYINSNILYLQECISYCINNNIKNFIYFSAISIYGNIDKENISEIDPLYHPNIYGTSKFLGEKMLENTGLNILILRLPMVLTLNEEIGVLNRFRKLLVSNKDIYINNYDKLFNNFIYYEDVLNFILKYKFHEKYEVLNFSTYQKYTLFSIIEFMKNYLNSSSNIFKDEKEQEFFNIDINKLLNKYNPKLSDPKESIKRWLNEINSR